MRNLDFSSWQALLSTLLGLAVFTLIGVGIRLIVMQTIQQRRQRENRQVNERLRTLIAAYKTLGGSFTGSLLVDPTHLRDLRPGAKGGPASGTAPVAASNPGTASSGTTTGPVQTLASPTLPATDLATTDPITSSERRRRIRDAVEAALSDIILLGTEEQVRMAAHAATEMAQGRPVHTADLVISLRNFIRKVLDLAPIPANVIIPEQGPARPSAAGAKGKDSGKDGGGGGSNAGGGAGGGGGGAGMGMGMGLGVGAAHGLHDDDSTTS